MENDIEWDMKTSCVIRVSRGQYKKYGLESSYYDEQNGKENPAGGEDTEGCPSFWGLRASVPNGEYSGKHGKIHGKWL